MYAFSSGTMKHHPRALLPYWVLSRVEALVSPLMLVPVVSQCYVLSGDWEEFQIVTSHRSRYVRLLIESNHGEFYTGINRIEVVALEGFLVSYLGAHELYYIC